MGRFGIQISTKEIAAILAAISIAALTAFFNPGLVGIAPPQDPTARMATLSPIAGIAAPAKQSPLKAGEQIRSTPDLLEPASKLCETSACRTLANTPTQSWEGNSAPAIDTVIEQR
ncbi:MAG: hypothetical protein COB53_08640 [Elusimicrobia bacterium]|nr:MAG: hypothetical protein COB53_08640 [Elusimicrobiota bacterium]